MGSDFKLKAVIANVVEADIGGCQVACGEYQRARKCLKIV
jgi:hypothetical protein